MLWDVLVRLLQTFYHIGFFSYLFFYNLLRHFLPFSPTNKHTLTLLYLLRLFSFHHEPLTLFSLFKCWCFNAFAAHFVISFLSLFTFPLYNLFRQCISLSLRDTHAHSPPSSPFTFLSLPHTSLPAYLPFLLFRPFLFIFPVYNLFRHCISLSLINKQDGATIKRPACVTTG